MPIYLQMLCTTMAVCSNMFYIAIHETQIFQVLVSMIHMNAMIMQLFLLTYAGNQVYYAVRIITFLVLSL